MNFYRDITLAAPTAALTSFPVLVRIQNDKMKARIASSQGFDVAFQQNGTNLPFDLDYYDSTTGSGAWWVQVPSLPSGSLTTIRMVYGDSSITTNQSTPSSVWTGYSVVHHLNDSSNLVSSVGDFTIAFGGNPFADVSLVPNAFTGKGMRFLVSRGYGDSYSWFQFANRFETSTATISILASTDVIPFSDRYCRYDSGWTVYKLHLEGNQFMTCAGNVSLTLTCESTNGLYCYGGSTNSTEIGFVVNGAVQDTSSGTPGHLRSDWPSFWFTGTSTSPTELIIDEIRVSTTQYRNSAWLAYEQNQVIHHATYTTYGAEYHSDGTPVTDFHPWLFRSVCLD